MDILIKLLEVEKTYPGENEVCALQKVNLEVKKGEFISIVGSSGSGKSTLMNILGCLDLPSGGQYFLESRDVSSLDENELSKIRNQKIGFIFQGFNLVPTLTAIENVELPLYYRGVKREERHRLALEALDRVGLSHRTHHLPARMSGGQQQRVAIARALASKPPIILADEPTGNLDSTIGSDVMQILLELNKEGKTVILITHDMELANLAKRVIKVSDGRIVG